MAFGSGIGVVRRWTAALCAAAAFHGLRKNARFFLTFAEPCWRFFFRYRYCADTNGVSILMAY